MAKKVKTKIKMQIKGGGATPAPPVGSALGQHQVNIMDFCKRFNAATGDKRGKQFPSLLLFMLIGHLTLLLKLLQLQNLFLKRLMLKRVLQGQIQKKLVKFPGMMLKKLQTLSFLI